MPVIRIGDSAYNCMDNIILKGVILMFIYTVRPGNSIYYISQLFGTDQQKIIEGNQIENPNVLVIGQAIVVPVESVRHTVVQGETLRMLALRYQVPVAAILRANPQITDPSLIRTGEVLTIPSQTENLGEKSVNGYAFPTINESTLEKTLPNLTYCTVFSYQVKADGSLAQIDDERTVNAARQKNTAPMMSITNIKPGGGFSSELASEVLTNETAWNNLLNNAVQTMNSKKYFGLNIDFEYVLQKDKEAYNDFVKAASDRVHESGFILSTSLAPKTGAAQRGLLYEAHDYPVHGRYTDFVILMTYEWGYTYGPARAVAPLNLVEQVIRYAVSVIPNQKIFMGIPNYGYDWTLPFVQGTAAKPLTNPGAVSLAARVGARIYFDSAAQSPYFSYYDVSGRRHEVWFEDARSINAKLRLADRYGLGGVSYWTINSYFAQNWLILDSTFKINKVLGI